MVKKIAALAGAVAMFLVVVVPVSAQVEGLFDGPWWSWDEAYVYNSAIAEANTGGNSQGNYAAVKGCFNSADADSSSGDRRMRTGPASAFATAVVVANADVGCDACDYEPWDWDYAWVKNGAYAGANTGGNSQNNSAVASGYDNSADADSGSGDRWMGTGPASADADAWVVVNPEMSFFPLP